MKTMMQKAGANAQRAYTDAGKAATEALSSIRTVMAFGGEHTELRKYTKHLGKAERAGIKGGLIMGASIGFFFFSMYSSYAIGLWYGSSLIVDDRRSNPVCEQGAASGGCFTGGDVITVFLGILIGCMMLGNMFPNLSNLAQAQAAAYYIFQVIDSPPTILNCNSTGVKERSEVTNGEVVFSNVVFEYPSRPGQVVLNSINLHFEAGKCYALVGSSGCGKSSCIQLIQRLYDVNDGQVTIDGEDIRKFDPHLLRQSIGVVSQEPQLFSGTVRENIAFGSLKGRETPLDDIKNAAKTANIHEFIETLPQGYDTELGGDGGRLSGGQKQR